MEALNTEQEVVTKNIPKKKKCKKAKRLSEEALQTAEKRRAVKGKDIANWIEFQRIAGRDEKGFLSEQYKEIEENNRMEKTRDLFKNIRNIKKCFMQKWTQ